jgi:hypothetical protein
LDVSSRKPLANLHRAIALGAMPRIGRVFGAGDVLFGLQLLLLLLLLLGRAEKVKAKRSESGTPPVGQEAEVPSLAPTCVPCG